MMEYYLGCVKVFCAKIRTFFKEKEYILRRVFAQPSYENTHFTIKIRYIIISQIKLAFIYYV